MNYKISPAFRADLLGSTDMAHGPTAASWPRPDRGILFSSDPPWCQKMLSGSWEVTPWFKKLKSECIKARFIQENCPQDRDSENGFRQWLIHAEDGAVELAIRCAVEHGRTNDGRVVRDELLKYLEHLILKHRIPYEIQGYSMIPKRREVGESIDQVAAATMEVAIATREVAKATHNYAEATSRVAKATNFVACVAIFAAILSALVAAWIGKG